MKKVFSVIGYILLIALLLFAFCGKIAFSLQDDKQASFDEGYQQGYRDGYNECDSKSYNDDGYDGYEKGYSSGYDEGVDAAKSGICWRLQDDYWSLIYDMDVEEAIHTLRLYDEGEPVSASELSQAIETIYAFYEEVDVLIDGIEYYRID